MCVLLFYSGPEAYSGTIMDLYIIKFWPFWNLKRYQIIPCIPSIHEASTQCLRVMSLNRKRDSDLSRSRISLHYVYNLSLQIIYIL